MKIRPEPVRRIFRVLASAMAFAWMEVPIASADDAKAQAIYAAALPSVVKIVIATKGGNGHGCGYVVDPSGVVLTNAHVVKPARRKDLTRVYVTFPADRDRKEYSVEGWLDIMPSCDLACVRFEPGDRKCKSLKLAESLPKPGEAVVQIGRVDGYDNTISFGAVTAFYTGRDVDRILSENLAQPGVYYYRMVFSPEATWIEHNSPLLLGNSGAPLVNTRGEVVGLNSWHLATGHNLNFAISSQDIRRFLAQANKTAKPWGQLPKWKGAGEDEEPGTPPSPNDAERKAIYAAASPSLVKIIVETKRGAGWGCGYVADSSGVVLTNAHVIKVARWKDFKRVYVTFPADRDRKEYAVESWLDVMPSRDLACVRFRSGDRKCQALKLAEKLPKPGETVVEVGRLGGYDNSVSYGTVIANRTGREIDRMLSETLGKKGFYENQMGFSLDATWIQHSAPMSPGNSGAPLVDARGEVVGLTTWHLATGENLNFAISSLDIRKFLAGASKVAKPWSQLPKWKGVGDDEDEADLGDAPKTLAAWKEYARAKSTGRWKAAAAERELEKLPPVAAGKPAKDPKSRNQEKAAIFRQLAKVYSECAAQLKAIDTKLVDRRLTALLREEADFARRMSDTHQELSAEFSAKPDIEKPTDGARLSKLKETVGVLPSKSDIVRILLSRSYDMRFPPIAEVAEDDAEQRPGDRPGFRLWTSSSGRFHLRAKYLGMEGDKVKLEKLDLAIIRVPLASLSEADQRFIKEMSGDPKRNTDSH